VLRLPLQDLEHHRGDNIQSSAEGGCRRIVSGEHWFIIIVACPVTVMSILLLFFGWLHLSFFVVEVSRAMTIGDVQIDFSRSMRTGANALGLLSPMLSFPIRAKCVARWAASYAADSLCEIALSASCVDHVEQSHPLELDNMVKIHWKHTPFFTHFYCLFISRCTSTPSIVSQSNRPILRVYNLMRHDAFSNRISTSYFHRFSFLLISWTQEHFNFLEHIL
jgi:hypothetical protein